MGPQIVTESRISARVRWGGWDSDKNCHILMYIVLFGELSLTATASTVLGVVAVGKVYSSHLTYPPIPPSDLRYLSPKQGLTVPGPRMCWTLAVSSSLLPATCHLPYVPPTYPLCAMRVCTSTHPRPGRFSNNPR